MKTHSEKLMDILFDMDISANEYNVSNIETICSRFRNLGWKVTVC